jgi:hypothetical protein
MLEGLRAPTGAMVVMDAHIATAANLQCLVAQGYRYLVARRGGERQFDPDQAVAIISAGGDEIRIQKVLSKDGKEARLYSHSPGCCEAKDNAMNARILERIGRLKQASRGVSQYYDITFEADAEQQRVNALRWERGRLPAQPSQPSRRLLPGHQRNRLG